MSTTTQAQQQILVEHFGAVELTLDEATEGRLMVEGVCGRAGSATANKRTYPMSIMEREIKKLNERVGKGYPVLGSLDHPSDGKSRLKDASHLIHKVWMEADGTMKMRAEILEETENGKIAAAIVRRTKKIGMSSRGMGSTSMGPNGKEVVNEDYKLATFDFVADPAVSDAYPVKLGEDINADDVTAESLRLTFPGQVEALEENARLAALQTLQQAAGIGPSFSKEDIVQKAIEEYKDQIHTAVYEEARAELVEGFGVRLTRALQEMRVDVEKKVRAELASDPAEASAKLTLEKLAETLIPFRPTGNAKTLLAANANEIAELKAQFQEAVTYAEASESKLVAMAKKARKLAFENHVIKTVAGREDAQAVVEMVGDLEEIDTVEELKKRLGAAIDHADAASAKARQRVEGKERRARARVKQIESRERRFRQKTKERDAQIAESVERITSKMQDRLRRVEDENRVLRENFSRASEALERADQLTERLDDYAFASRRTVGHPDRDGILDDVRHGRVRSRRGINQLAEERDLRGEESGGVNERIRRSMSRGREYAPAPLTESRERRQISDLAEFGIHVDDILPLSRGNRG